MNKNRPVEKYILLLLLPFFSGCFSASYGPSPKTIAADIVTLPVQAVVLALEPTRKKRENEKSNRIQALENELERDPILIVSRNYAASESNSEEYIAFRRYLMHLHNDNLPDEVILYLFPIGQPSPLNAALLYYAIPGINLPQEVIDDYYTRIAKGEEMHLGTVSGILRKLPLEKLDETAINYAGKDFGEKAAELADHYRSALEHEERRKRRDEERKKETLGE